MTGVRVVVAIMLAGCGRLHFDPVGEGGTADGGLVDGASDRPNRMFLSSETMTGDLGGLAGADAKCSMLASAAGLDGTFIALLWANEMSASSRLAGSRGWVDPNGRPMLDRPNTDESIHPLNVDERGTPILNFVAGFWGGPAADGGTCNDWTFAGPSGPFVIEVKTSLMTDAYSGCGGPHHLPCAEIGHAVAVVPPIETGRIAFVSAGLFQPGGGLAAADALCQQEAAAAGLSGSFVAFLASSAGEAETRLASNGLPWRRVDGPRLRPLASDIAGPSPVATWDTFIGRTATGAATNARVWVGTQAENCTNWTSGATTGTIGRSNSVARSHLQLFPNTGCLSQANVMCFEQ
jgi:hypothetical protein